MRSLNVHCTMTGCYEVSPPDAEASRSSIAEEERSGAAAVAQRAEQLTERLTVRFTEMRYRRNMSHSDVSFAHKTAQTTQVETIDSIYAAMEGTLDATNLARLRGACEAAKHAASDLVHGHNDNGRQRERNSRAMFNPLEVATTRSFSKGGRWNVVADIPIDASVERMLQNPELCHSAFTEHKHVPGTYSDILDGELYRTHPLFEVDKRALAFILYAGLPSLITRAIPMLTCNYADDFELLNPIGQKKGVKKVTVFYYQLANLHPSTRVETKNIQVSVSMRLALSRA